MTHYLVKVPITGYLTVRIKADGEATAKELALNADFRVTTRDDDNVEPGEFDTHKKVVEGNVFNGMCNEMEIELDPYAEDDDQ